jgi:acetoacetyl-CoA synthetase
VQPIAEVPRTLSGKALEVPVKRILMGAPPATTVSRESLQNPDSLTWFEEYGRMLRERRPPRRQS